MTGKFIVIEGIDGAGKSTQVELLKSHPALQGAHFTAEPTHEGIGAIVRTQIRKDTPEYTPETMAALLVADRLEHLSAPETGLLARLQSGQHVVCDRYVLSSLAYQSLTAPMELVWALNQPCLGLRLPDLTLYLDLTPEQSMARIEARGLAQDSFESLQNLTRIRAHYQEGLRRMPEHPCYQISADQSMDAVAAIVREKVDKVLSA